MAESVKIESLTDEEKEFIEKYRRADNTIKKEIEQKILSNDLE